MFIVIALTFVVAVAAQYGGNTANDNVQQYPSQPVYYPQVYSDYFYDSRDDSDSREHRRRNGCAKIRTYLGTSVGAPDDAFYPPIIRYVRSGRKVQALIVCDRNPKNANLLLVRHNSSVELRQSHLAAIGTTAGMIATCDRDEDRYFGPVLDATTISKNVKVTQVTCLGIDKTHLGRESEFVIDSFVSVVGQLIISVSPPPVNRRKRDATEETTTTADITTEATTTVAVDATTTVETVTTITDATTEAVTTASTATEAVTETTTTSSSAVTDVTTVTDATTVAGTETSAAETSIEQIDFSKGKITEEELSQIKDPQTAMKVIMNNMGRLLGKIV